MKTKDKKTYKVMITAGKMLIAPFIGLLYAAILPFAFAYAIGKVVLGGIFNLAGGTMSFGWRPVEAYFTGKKRKKEEEEEEAGKNGENK